MGNLRDRTKRALAPPPGALPGEKGDPRESTPDQGTVPHTEAQRATKLAVEVALKDARRVVIDVDK